MTKTCEDSWEELGTRPSFALAHVSHCVALLSGSAGIKLTTCQIDGSNWRLPHTLLPQAPTSIFASPIRSPLCRVPPVRQLDEPFMRTSQVESVSPRLGVKTARDKEANKAIMSTP
ncbi:unnamed protein product [Caenorhabditis auriculariae]|uniref:Uncharacterized protein n=1 Tax=Caenorhabditis auriculariae TaxID=2777116 RepID=A0A8S1HXM5_9PELO|nr:unnamed protein product [Caenorhabditis auriculariae]